MNFFLILFLGLTFGLPSLLRSEDSPVTYEQTVCKDLKALSKLPPPPNQPTHMDTKVWVAKIMQDSSASSDPLYCGPYETSPSCGAIRMEIVIDNNGNPEIKTAALKTNTGDVNLYSETLEPTEEHFLSWKATLKEVKLYTAADQQINAVDIPPELQLKRDPGIALIGASPKKLWALYGSCNKLYSWVIVADAVVKDQLLDDQMKQEIDDAIKKAGFDPLKFTNLEFRLPDPIDSFIPLTPGS